MIKLDWLNKEGIDPVTLCFAYAVSNAHLILMEGEQFYGINLEEVRIPKDMVAKIVENGWAVIEKGCLVVGSGGVFSTDFTIDTVADSVEEKLDDSFEIRLAAYKEQVDAAFDNYKSARRTMNFTSTVPTTFNRIFKKIRRGLFTEAELVTFFNVTIALYHQSQLFSQTSTTIEKSIVKKILRAGNNNGDVFIAMVFEYIFNYNTYNNSTKYDSPTLAGLSYSANKVLIGISKPIKKDEPDKL